LDWIVRLGVAPDAPIIDVGGGTSPLAADLLAANYTNITVLDVSGAAISRAQMGLGAGVSRITWLEADITTVDLPAGYYAIWHDRAVFHFLTTAQERQQYIQRVTAALQSGGHVIIATFALDGPMQCSGLVTARYSTETLQFEFGETFTLVESAHETHTTPFGTQQQFIYCHFKKRE
jgi:ubiquinone/menaquinone biosynthesis C-methylase UbiE